MKRLLAIILTAAMVTSALTITSFAATSDEKQVTSLHFKVESGSMEAGTDPDDLDLHNVKIECTDVQWDSNANKGTATVGTAGSSNYPYPGLTVEVGDFRMVSPSKTLKIGETVKYKFYVYISGSDQDGKTYVLSSGIKPHVSAADGSTGPSPKTTNKQRNGYYELAVTVTTGPIKGQYDSPENLEWQSGSSLGQASWDKPESGNSSDVYDLRLRRDGKLVVEFSSVSGRTMNFYPWMTREGDYSFEVRCAVPGSKSGAKKSDWAESDSQWVDENHVSDGSGQYDPSGTGGSGGSGTTNGKVGWVKNGNTWYYYYPDGTMRKNGWEKVNNKWYYFDASGAMKTGWVTVNGQTYYLDTNNGDMKTGWVKTSDGQWYYLNPNPSAGTEGAMYKNQWLVSGGQTYFLKDTGAMATGWLKIDGRFFYFNPNEGGPKGAMLKNTRIDSFYVGADGAWVQGA